MASRRVSPGGVGTMTLQRPPEPSPDDVPAGATLAPEPPKRPVPRQPVAAALEGAHQARRGAAGAGHRVPRDRQHQHGQPDRQRARLRPRRHSGRVRPAGRARWCTSCRPSGTSPPARSPRAAGRATSQDQEQVNDATTTTAYNAKLRQTPEAVRSRSDARTAAERPDRAGRRSSATWTRAVGVPVRGRGARRRRLRGAGRGRRGPRAARRPDRSCGRR